MRSEAVFRASKRSQGRFHLCLSCEKGTRAIHKSNDRIQDSINIAFGIIGQGDQHIQQKSLFELQLQHLYMVEENRAVARWMAWRFQRCGIVAPDNCDHDRLLL